MINVIKVIVERNRLKLFLAKAVQGEKMVFSFKQPGENLQRTSNITIHDHQQW